jgi:C_GCAxxG_C_C family probable redox protein
MKTKSEINISKASDESLRLFGNGFHCAEAVAAVVLKELGEESMEAAAHASGFGGGIGATHEEICGAITGGVIAIGHIHGRRKPGGDWKKAAKASESLRKRFLEKYPSTICSTIIDSFEEQDQMAACKKLVHIVTTLTLEILTESEEKSPFNTL